MLFLIVLGLGCLAGAAYFVGDAVTAPARERQSSVRRAATYGRFRPALARGQLPFRERVLVPLGERLARWTLKLHPKTTTEGVGTRLLAAGLGRKISPTTFLALKSACAIGGFALGALFGGALTGAGGVLLFAIALAGVGVIGPDFAVSAKARSRRETIRAELPDALDLMAVSVEAGMGFDGAIAKLTEHMDGPLADEFGLTLNEIRIGETRQDALKKLADRTDTPELSARPAGEVIEAAVNPDLEGLKAELEASKKREASPHEALNERSQAHEKNAGSQKQLAQRAATLDDREAKLAEFEVELEERERRMRDQREAIEAEHARVADLQAELAAEQALAEERREQAEARMRDLKGADRDREKAAADLRKQQSALADRERKLAKKENELATREQATTVRLQGRERSLEKRENEWRTRDKELTERERRLSARESDLKKDSARVAAKDEALGEREAELMLKQERMRNDAERLERELAEKGQVAREAVARSADLDRRELDLTAREAELNRLQASISHAERDANRGRDLEEWNVRLEQRERELAAREAELSNVESVADSQKKRAERREQRLGSMEQTLHDRIKELDDREAELELREAGFEADHEIRLDKLEKREQALTELEGRLKTQETELAAYVAKAQTEIQRREAEWWQKQLGSDAEVPAA